MNRYLTGLRKRLGVAGLVAAGVLFGQIGACNAIDEPAPQPSPELRATCDEPASWCHTETEGTRP